MPQKRSASGRIVVFKEICGDPEIPFWEKFIIYYEVDEELMDLRVFRLMLQPLVENSILHGVRYKEDRVILKSRSSAAAARSISVWLTMGWEWTRQKPNVSETP